MHNLQEFTFLSEEKTIVTTPFLLDLLDSALVENIQAGNLQAAYSVLDLSINISETLDQQPFSHDEGKQLLASVRKAMENGNVSSAKQHMIEFALK
ncbi:hypothetical protein [uncultured Sphaerochaeta sp.]|uniref:hypothetical protein n=1 Tax=uncultured Sphaerochaeta sp. TaxID=886478 RepID=UPI002A0A1256|nr:hypothetical protein [uncultured Sphaerochaeta sp.]